MTRWITALTLVAGCGGEDSVTEPLSPELGSIQARVLTPSCTFSACHDSSDSAGELNLLPGTAHAALVGREAVMAPGRLLVAPGDPGASFLVAKLRGDLGESEGYPMPYGTEPLDEDLILAVEEWITRGALP